jgi:hypothetical protein
MPKMVGRSVSQTSVNRAGFLARDVKETKLLKNIVFLFDGFGKYFKTLQVSDQGMSNQLLA